jgi:hypothetical protein
MLVDDMTEMFVLVVPFLFLWLLVLVKFFLFCCYLSN